MNTTQDNNNHGLNWRIVGVDIDNELKRMGYALTLQEARKVKRTIARTGVTCIRIQNIKSGTIYR